MSRRYCLLLVASLATTGPALASGISLPTWDAQEQRQLEESGWLPGVDLLSDETADADANPFAAEAPTADDLPAPPTTVPKISDQDLATYFGARPATWLVDPQHLLGTTASQEVLAMLESHAADSSIDLFVYVFGKDQEIPGEMREEEVIERFFMADRPAVIVYYFWGRPQQTVIYLSPSITDAVAPAEQRRALASSVMQALEKAAPDDQLRAFIGQMGIRIYGMESLIGMLPSAIGGPLPSHQHPTKTPKNSSALAVLTAEWQSTLEAYLPQIGAVLAAIVTLAAGGCWWRWRARYRLPEFEVEPRLGGDHAAGIGAVISFASPTLPPASQRNQVPEYLRRC